MDAFEQIVSGLFRANGYWTINSYRVSLTREEKAQIGTHSMPRPEIDILAYKGSTNELIWIECKSYLDSPGVGYKCFTDEKDAGYSRYKVFNKKEYRECISKALIKQTTEKGLTQANPKLSYCLVAGNARSPSERKMTEEYFIQNGWLFYDDRWLKAELEKYAKSAYEDDPVMIVAKIILRGLDKED